MDGLHLASVEPRTGDALVLVDIQCDFLRGGPQAVPGAEGILPVLNDWIGRFTAAGLPVFAVRQWHPALHCSFAPLGGLQPPHCVAGTPGARFAPGLALPPDAFVVSRGTLRHLDAPSGFRGTDLAQRLRERGIGRLFVGGFSTEAAVHETVLDALAQGFIVVLLADAVRSLEAVPGDGAAAVSHMQRMGAHVAAGVTA